MHENKEVGNGLWAKPAIQIIQLAPTNLEWSRNNSMVFETSINSCDDDGRINFNVAYSPKTARTRNS